MNSKRVYYLLVAVQCLLAIAVVGGTYVGNSLLKKQTERLISLKTDSKVLDEQQTALVQANKDIAKYAELEKTAKTIVPQDKDQARVVRQIVSYAADTKIPIQNISFPSSTLGQAPVKSSSAGATSSSSVATAKPAVSQLKAVDGLSGVYSMEITVDSDTTKPVGYDQLVDFLEKLEKSRRTAQVTTINVTPNANNRKLVTFSLIVTVYVKP
mgnify:CR=1 FL=1